MLQTWSKRLVRGATLGAGVAGAACAPRAIRPLGLIAATAVHTEGASPPQPILETNFAGRWVKDRNASDSMDPALDMMNIKGLTRTAVQLVRGMDIHQTSDSFEMAIFSVIPKIKIREKYQFDGTPSVHRRRDLRSGKHTAAVRWIEGGKKLQLDLTWDEPFGGTGCDIFSMPSPDTLLVDSVVRVGGQEVAYRSIYHSKQHK